MIKRQHLLPFDIFQQMVHWLSSSQHSYRKGRRYLESNLYLLQIEADRELARLVRAYNDEAQELQQPLRDHLYLMRDACKRGATRRAIHEAYVNVYGGLSLELPAWLEEIEQQRAQLLKIHRPDRTSRTHIQLLRRAIAQARQASKIAPEITAELLNELGNVLIQSSHYPTQQQRLQAIEEAIHCHESASAIFTASDYPLQYARTAFCLGNACYHYARAGYHNAAERALSSYNLALRMYTSHDYPIQWAMLQTSKGRVYTLQGRVVSACHEAALKRISRESSPFVWAHIQVNLGDTCRLCASSKPDQRGDNLGRAMSCYRAALQVYTSATAPREWADIHIRLATIYQRYAYDAEQDSGQQDKYMRCAIVCCEGALMVYSPDSFPVEYAATQVCLGQLHRTRSEGERQINLELARACYQHALHIFTSSAFPLDQHRVLLALRETETQLHVARS